MIYVLNVIQMNWNYRKLRMINENSKYAQAFIGKALYDSVARYCKKVNISQAKFYGFCINQFVGNNLASLSDEEFDKLLKVEIFKYMR